MIIALALFLILHNKSEREQAVYAESITINGPREISMGINTKLEFMSGFVSIEPANFEGDLKYNITPKSIKNQGGLTIENNLIKANKVGAYNLMISVSKSNTKDLTETITIIVNENDDAINIKRTSLILSEPTEIEDIFSVNSKSQMTLQVDENLNLTNTSITPKMVGESTIFVDLISRYVKHKFSFSVSVVPKDNFDIIISKIVKDETGYKIKIDITNEGKEHCCEDICILETDNIEDIKYEFPIISLKPTHDGKVSFTISLTWQKHVVKTIEFETF